MATARGKHSFLPALPALPVNSGAYQRRRDGLVSMLDALHRLHLPVAPADFPAHVLGVLGVLLPGHEWTFASADRNGDGPAAAWALAAAAFDSPLGEMTLHVAPRPVGANRQRAEALLQALVSHVTLARVNCQRPRHAAAFAASSPPDGEAALTPREQEILHWLSEGKRDAEIAVILSISARTVQKHVQNLLAKLGVETRTAAVRNLGGGGSKG